MATTLYGFKITHENGTDRLVKDRQAMHKYLCKLADTSRKDSEILYHVDQTDRSVYVQSNATFKSTNVLEMFNSASVDKRVADYKINDKVHFTLTTPVTIRSRKSNGRICEIFVTDQANAIRLFAERLKKKGVMPYIIKPLFSSESAINHTKNKGGIYTIDPYTFEVEGCVTDPKAFANACLHGFGREKAYGCGLILPQ